MRGQMTLIAAVILPAVWKTMGHFFSQKVLFVYSESS